MSDMLKILGFDPARHKISTEISAGITAFLTMAYILAVNPTIFSSVEWMPPRAVFTATAVASAFATLLMALYAKRPFCVAPGMGLNAFFVYTVCIMSGHNWRFALTAVFVEAVIALILSLTNTLTKIANAIPQGLKNAITAGIGLFIAFVGLQSAGIVVKSDTTLVSLGNITQGAALLGVIGLTITCILITLDVKGGILIGIIATTIIGLFIKDPETGEVLTELRGQAVSMPESLSPIFCKIDFRSLLVPDFWVVVLALLFYDMFSVMGSVVALSGKSGYVDSNGNPLNSGKCFAANSIGSIAASLCGTSTMTIFMESASGIGSGGRSGLTSLTTAVCFVLALLFSNVFLAIPAPATAAPLVIIGVMTISSVSDIDWTDYREAIPAFLALVIMPMTYSIADGVFIGIIAYTVLSLVEGKRKDLSPLMYILTILFILKYIFL